MSPATRNHLLPDAIYISSLRVASARILIQLSDSMAGSDQAEVAAAALLPLKKKKGSALDLACGNSSPATSQLGAGMSLESLVQKAMRDNLKGWSETELNGNRNSSGQTCLQKLTDAKSFWLKDPKGNPMGKKFYAELRAAFRDDSSPQKQLKSQEGTIPCSEALQAMHVYKKSGSRAQMMNWLAKAGELNHAEMVGICNFALEVKASTSAKQLRIGIALVQFFVDRKLFGTYPAEAKHMMQWVDQVLCQVHAKAKQNRQKPSRFIQCNRDLVLVLLPQKELDELLDHTGAWHLAEQQLIKVVTSSSLGKEIFGFAIRQVLGSIVTRETDAALQALSAKKKLEDEDVKQSKKELLQKLGAEPGMKELADKRTIQVEYRGVQLDINIGSLVEDVDFRYAACLKSEAVDVGLINPIFCENDLVRARPAGLHEGRLQESVYCRWESARDSINEWLEASSSQEGATVVSLLTKKEAGMRAIDATFRLEVQFFSQLVGDAGERILQQQVKGCFPTLAKAVTEEQCLASLKVIQSGQLFKFVGAAAQGAVTNASTLVQHLSEGRQPNFAKNASEFLTEVKLGLGFFCRVEADGGTLVGEEAARYACDAVLEQNDTKPEQLEVPIKFCWLLDEDRFKRIEALRARIFQETTTTLVSAMKHGSGSTSCNKRVACPASSSASSSGPRKRASCTDSQLAMQMFRGVP